MSSELLETKSISAANGNLSMNVVGLDREKTRPDRDRDNKIAIHSTETNEKKTRHSTRHSQFLFLGPATRPVTSLWHGISDFHANRSREREAEFESVELAAYIYLDGRRRLHFCSQWQLEYGCCRSQSKRPD